MNALADAAFMTASEGGQGFGGGAAYTDAEMRSFGMGVPPGNMMPAAHAQMGAALLPQPLPIAGGRNIMPAPQLPGPGRHLQILDHTVHRIDAHTKANGEEEKEMVVSNLRHFTLKIGVLDPRMGIGRDSELPLKARCASCHAPPPHASRHTLPMHARP